MKSSWLSLSLELRSKNVGLMEEDLEQSHAIGKGGFAFFLDSFTRFESRSRSLFINYLEVVL